MITGWVDQDQLNDPAIVTVWKKYHLATRDKKYHLIADDTLQEIKGWLKSIKETANGYSDAAQEIRNCAQYCLDELEGK